jgi:hypothetical protein
MTRFCSKIFYEQTGTKAFIFSGITLKWSFHSMWAIQRETERNSGLGSSWSSFWGTLSLISQLIYDDINYEQTGTKAKEIDSHHCLYCDTTFPQFDDLIKHSRENHPYHCYYCKTTFVAGPGFVNDVTAWWPGFVKKKITNKQEPKQQKSTATIVYTVIPPRAYLYQ